jgi:hypothetical protein
MGSEIAHRRPLVICREFLFFFTDALFLGFVVSPYGEKKKTTALLGAGWPDSTSEQNRPFLSTTFPASLGLP